MQSSPARRLPWVLVAALAPAGAIAAQGEPASPAALVAPAARADLAPQAAVASANAATNTNAAAAPLAPAAPAPVLDADWAFRPLTTATPPVAADAEWNEHPIDRFVAAGLAAAGLAPAPRADRRTLIRRATFVLTGLPPTPAEVDAFVGDPSPDAFARVVDRLLASPHHGEQQARHWLDLARYSDSNGLDENLAFGNAWRYRDWVVQAHNRDLPFDRFVVLQLAGDLLADEPDVGLDGHVATGFLALGPRMLAEQDKEKLVLDTVDEQLDLVGRTVLGLTIGCARCHDHKFDPISQRDYYALAGVFRSTKSFHDLEHVSKWFDRELATPAAIAARTAAVVARDAAARELASAQAEAVAAQRRALAADADRYRAAGAALLARSVLVQAEAARATSLRTDAATWGDATTTVLHTHRAGEQFAEWTVHAPAPGRHRLLVRFAAAAARPLRFTLDGAEIAAAACGDVTGGWLPAHQRWHDVVELELGAGEHTLRAVATTEHAPHLDALLLTPCANDGDAAGLAPAVVPHVAALLALGGTPATAPPAEGAPAAIAAAAARGPAEPFGLPDTVLLTALPPAAHARLQELAARRDTLAAAVPPRAPMVMCVGDGDVKDLPLHYRGNHLTLAPAATPRGVLSVFAAFVPPPPLPGDASGRLQLAQWLFAPEQALAARVHANRIWQRAFGHGLVRSPSNFGRRGDRPAQPALLDWLAADLRAHGWSQKHLWRRILLSRTWQQASLGDAAAVQRDPENRLLGRQQRQRLAAESIRDAMLAVGGALVRSLGGSLLATEDRGYVTNDQSRDAASYDTPRRSLYLPIVRNAMYDLFAAFDYADPSVHLEQRPQSAVATQALFLLNAPLVREQSRALAARVLAAATTDDARLDRLWSEALQRQPSATERAAARAWLARGRGPDAGDELAAWTGVAQALFASNEFVYVD